MIEYLKKMVKECGFAVTVDMFILEIVPLMFVLYVIIHKVLWKLKKIIIYNE